MRGGGGGKLSKIAWRHLWTNPKGLSINDVRVIGWKGVNDFVATIYKDYYLSVKMGVIFFSNFCDLIINDFTHILILITLLMYSGLYAESQNPWPFLFRLKHHLLPGHKHELCYICSIIKGSFPICLPSLLMFTQLPMTKYRVSLPFAVCGYFLLFWAKTNIPAYNRTILRMFSIKANLEYRISEITEKKSANNTILSPGRGRAGHGGWQPRRTPCRSPTPFRLSSPAQACNNSRQEGDERDEHQVQILQLTIVT